ncbi:hypothetical protein ACK340_13170, partial [Aeromonas veronii]
EEGGGDQITESSVSSIQAASIWATTPLEAIPGAAPKIGLLVRDYLQTVVCLVPLGRFIEPTPFHPFHHPALLPYRA